MILAPTPQELEEAQEQDRERFQRPRIEKKNVGFVFFLEEPPRIPFQGRMYEVPLVSYLDGLRVSELLEELDGLAREEVTAEWVVRSRAWHAAAIATIRRLVRPDRGRLRRFRWRFRLLRNPFRLVTAGEVGELLGFFAMCPTRSTVRPGLPPELARNPGS